MSAFTKETAASARAKLAEGRASIRAGKCRTCQTNQASITNGAGRGMCSTCNRARLREAKKTRAAEPPPKTPTPARGKTESKRKPRKPAAGPPATPPAPEVDPPSPKAQGERRKRLGGILHRALNTSISGKLDDE